MNKSRRKRIENVIEQLEELQLEISEIADEEQESYDNLPDNLNDTERANNMAENIDDLSELDQEFDSIKDTLQEILER